MSCHARISAVLTVAVLACNASIRLTNLTFNYDPKIAIVNITLDNSEPTSLLSFQEMRLREALKMMLVFTVFVPNAKDDKVYKNVYFKTSINLCNEYGRNKFKQMIRFNFNSTASTSEDTCPAKVGNFTRLNIRVPDLHLPYLPELKFRINVTQKDMLKGSKRFVFSQSLEAYGSIKNGRN